MMCAVIYRNFGKNAFFFFLEEQELYHHNTVDVTIRPKKAGRDTLYLAVKEYL